MNEGGLALNVSRSANLSSIFMYRHFFGGGEEREKRGNCIYSAFAVSVT